jgi:hypothetical protein
VNWQKMTARQQEAARDIADRLYELGAGSGGTPGVSVSQVAKYLDEAMAWDRGLMTLGALCEAAGWTYPPVPDRAAAGQPAPQAPIRLGGFYEVHCADGALVIETDGPFSIRPAGERKMIIKRA